MRRKITVLKNNIHNMEKREFKIGAAIMATEVTDSMLRIRCGATE